MPLPPLHEDASRLRRVWSFLRVLPVLGFLLLALLFGNLLQLGSLLVLPFSRFAFRKINREIADAWWGACVVASRRALGVRVHFSGDEVPAAESVVLIANHQEMTDIPVIFFLARAMRRLGDMKWFVKKPVKWVPGVGWGMQFLDCIFVDREWARDASTIEATFARIVRARVPLWLISFSEGTRLTPRKLEVARERAREKGLPEPRHVLLPRPRGFVASVQGLRDHVDAIYDVTIGYVGGVPTLFQYMRGLARDIHVHVRRFPMQDLPRDPEALAEWLRGRFVEKDARLDAFYREGVFSRVDAEGTA
jgi:lysophosphatidic acid acyltransferase/lysophosphatidylinositol acyltransferase